MNITTFVTKAIAITFAIATATSLQAAELVEVETNNITFTNEIHIELTQTVNLINTLALNVEQSAESMLITQSKKHFAKVDTDTTILVASAE